MKNLGSIDDREAFRINDYLVIEYEPIAAETAKTGDPEEVWANSEKSIAKQFRDLSVEAAQYLNVIQHTNAQIAQLLSVFDSKIRLLAEYIIQQDADSEQPPQFTNLSETGIAFGTQEQLEPGQLLRIKFTIKPSYHIISAYAEVVKCALSQGLEHADPKYPFWTALLYIQMPRPDQQALSRYILFKQTKQNA